MSEQELSRRRFIRAATAATAASALAGALRSQEETNAPGIAAAGAGTLRRVKLGRTGEVVPIIGMGTAPAGFHRELEEAASLFDEAIDLGVNYMDTAPHFTGYGKAQPALGRVFKKRRDKVFLVTKCFEPAGDAARKLLENNLKEMGTDHADLVYAHGVGDDKMEPDIVLGKNGVLEMLRQAKKEGLARYIGVSGHNRPGRFLRILREIEIDVMMCAVNFVDCHTYGFENTVFPQAAAKGVALVAMKVFGGMRNRGDTKKANMPPAFHDLAFRYALSIPDLSLAVIGMKDREELLENLERARAFKPLTEAERRDLEVKGKAMAAEWGPHRGAVV